MAFFNDNFIEIDGIGEAYAALGGECGYVSRGFFDAFTDLRDHTGDDDFIGLIAFVGDFLVSVSPPFGVTITTRRARLRWLMTAGAELVFMVLMKAMISRVLEPFAKVGVRLLGAACGSTAAAGLCRVDRPGA